MPTLFLADVSSSLVGLADLISSIAEWWQGGWHWESKWRLSLVQSVISFGSSRGGLGLWALMTGKLKLPSGYAPGLYNSLNHLLSCMTLEYAVWTGIEIVTGCMEGNCHQYIIWNDWQGSLTNKSENDWKGGAWLFEIWSLIDGIWNRLLKRL